MRVPALLAALSSCGIVSGIDDFTADGPAGAELNGQGGSGGIVPGTCGNGVVEGGEECDLGEPSTVCNAQCQVVCDKTDQFQDVATRHCYSLMGNDDWEAARAACELSPATHLATITSQAEYNFIYANVIGDAWIGGHDRNGDDNFEWVTGEPWWPDGWADAEPDGGDGCVRLAIRPTDPDNDGFNDADCADPYPYVCEHEPAPLR
jgi:hypothetical protein